MNEEEREEKEAWDAMPLREKLKLGAFLAYMAMMIYVEKGMNMIFPPKKPAPTNNFRKPMGDRKWQGRPSSLN